MRSLSEIPREFNFVVRVESKCEIPFDILNSKDFINASNSAFFSRELEKFAYNNSSTKPEMLFANALN